ncbi:MAG: hypothetical protein DWI04_07500 [Planctomycetota bacterium]|nr:MAG: hypothetical protein DWI04_07500 [Planctomycetota bacterium]
MGLYQRPRKAHEERVSHVLTKRRAGIQCVQYEMQESLMRTMLVVVQQSPYSQVKEPNHMPQFQIEGEAEIFDAAEEIDVRGEIARHSFVTAEKSPSDDTTVIITSVDPKDLSEFEGLLFQIDINEEEDLVILRQVQMFFWPWEDDEEFEEMGSSEDDPEVA